MGMLFSPFLVLVFHLLHGAALSRPTGWADRPLPAVNQEGGNGRLAWARPDPPDLVRKTSPWVGRSPEIETRSVNSGHWQEGQNLDFCSARQDIVMNLKNTFREPSPPRRLGETQAFALTSDDRLLVAVPDSYARGEISVFRWDGSLANTLGNRGTGWGEFDLIYQLLIGPGDSLFVLDRGNERITVFDERERVVEQIDLPGPPELDGMLRLPSGEFLVNANVGTPEAVGWPMHVISRSGELVSSFGAVTPAYRGDLPLAGTRSMALGEHGLIWAAHKKEYRLELWDTRNELKKTLVRAVPWFEPWSRNEPIGPDSPRRPVVQDIDVDDAGRIWVLVTRPSKSWRDHVGQTEAGRYFWTNIPDYHASVVEVVDPTRACVLGHLETEAFLRVSLGDGYFAAYQRDDQGEYVTIWELSLGGG